MFQYATEYILQVNIGDEDQKSGIKKNDIDKLISYCREINLDLVGLMCIPPANIDPEHYFREMKQLNKNNNPLNKIPGFIGTEKGGNNDNAK